MKLFIGIGGTGQHVALAITRLIRLGALPKMTGYIIDAEDGSNLAQSLKVFAGAEQLKHPLEGADKFHPPFSRDKLGSKGQFKGLFINNTQTDGVERVLFDLFFPEQDAVLNLSKGMYGRPSVGSTVLARSMGDTLLDFFDGIGMEAQVYVSGSFIGGTGAGIVHQLIGGLLQRKPGLEIFGTFFMPWFKLPPSVQDAIDDNLLDANMRHGLEYFSAVTLERMKIAVILGCPEIAEKDPRAQKLVGKAEVGADIAEIPHLFHLIAAYGVRLPELVSTSSKARGRVYTFAYDTDDPDSFLKLPWHTPPGLKERTLIDFYNKGVFVASIYRWLSTEHMRKEIVGAWSWKGSAKAISSGLKGTIDNHAEGKEQRLKLTGALGENWTERLRQLENSYSWLERLLDIRRKQFDFVERILREERKGRESALRLEVLTQALAEPIKKDETTKNDVNALAERIENRLEDFFWRQTH